MDGNTHAQRKWFVIDVNQHSEERAPVLSGGRESTSAAPFLLPNTLVEVERTRGDCCGCCACLAGCCARREEQRVTEGDGRGIGGTPILGAVAFVVVLVAVVLLVVLVWSLDGYEDQDESGSGGLIEDLYSSGTVR